MGTYELLFQQVIGRYLQVEVTLQRGGRSSAALRSLRAWYPRFSYAEHYLPAIYAETTSPRPLPRAVPRQLRGLLHRDRGEDRAQAPAARRPDRARGRPALAGLLVRAGARPAVERRAAPLPGPQRRPLLPAARGTVAGLLAILRVYLDPVVDDSVFAARAASTAAACASSSGSCTRTRRRRPPTGRSRGRRRQRQCRRPGRGRRPPLRRPRPGRLTRRPARHGATGSLRSASRRTPPSTCDGTTSSSSSGQARLGLDTELGAQPHPSRPMVLGPGATWPRLPRLPASLRPRRPDRARPRPGRRLPVPMTAARSRTVSRHTEPCVSPDHRHAQPRPAGQLRLRDGARPRRFPPGADSTTWEGTTCTSGRCTATARSTACR